MDTGITIPPDCAAHMRDTGCAIAQVGDITREAEALRAGLQRMRSDQSLQRIFLDELRSERGPDRRLIGTNKLFHDPTDNRWSFVFDPEHDDTLAHWEAALPELGPFFEANRVLCELARFLIWAAARSFDATIVRTGGKPYERTRMLALMPRISMKLRTSEYDPVEGEGLTVPEANTALISVILHANPGQTIFVRGGSPDAGKAEQDMSQAVIMFGKQGHVVVPWCEAAVHRVTADATKRRFVVKAYAYDDTFCVTQNAANRATIESVDAYA